MNKLTLTNLAIALIALLLSALNAYWNFLRKPKLHVIYEDEMPFRKYLTTITDPTSPEWYVRIKVINKRRAIAKKCVGRIVEWHTNNKLIESFDPIKLHWVSNDPDDFSAIDLSFQEFDFMDLVFTQSMEKQFRIYTNTHLRGIPLNFDINDRHSFKVSIYSEKEAYNFSWFVIQRDESLSNNRIINVSQVSEREIRSMAKDA